MTPTLNDQRGSVLIIAIIAMLILGILSFSFALLSKIELTTGVNYKIQAQAESLAEAGLERGRDAVRSAASETCGFTRWTDAAGSNGYGCGAGLAALLFNGVSLGPGTYSAVIDNDCSPLVPTAIQDAGCTGATPARDTNETAVVTAWATSSSGQGRARVRAVIGIDNPWKHVCSNSSQDNPPGYCNEPANRNGSPTITPADPNEYPGGPAAYDDLPRPQLGCSDIDPTVHGWTAAGCAAWVAYPGYLRQTYPYPAGATRLVVTGDRSVSNCDGGGLQYQGYFDCALTTPCDPAVFGNSICGGSVRKGCVKALPTPDTRAASNPSYYKLAPCGTDTGMVFRDADLNWNINYTPTNKGVLLYVMRGAATDIPAYTNIGHGIFQLQSNDLNGIVVIEGNGVADCNSNRDLNHKNGARIWTKQTMSWDGTNAYGNLYGYPLAYLIYDPVAAVANAPQPTANPLNPQNTCADMGSASGTEIHGLIYSGGHTQFNPVAVDGGVIAFEIQTQSSSAIYGYNTTFGNAAPPPGFPTGSGNQVILVRKSFLVCADYNADTGGGTSCR